MQAVSGDLEPNLPALFTGEPAGEEEESPAYRHHGELCTNLAIDEAHQERSPDNDQRQYLEGPCKILHHHYGAESSLP